MPRTLVATALALVAGGAALALVPGEYDTGPETAGVAAPINLA